MTTITEQRRHTVITYFINEEKKTIVCKIRDNEYLDEKVNRYFLQFVLNKYNFKRLKAYLMDSEWYDNEDSQISYATKYVCHDEIFNIDKCKTIAYKQTKDYMHGVLMQRINEIMRDVEKMGEGIIEMRDYLKSHYNS